MRLFSDYHNTVPYFELGSGIQVLCDIQPFRSTGTTTAIRYEEALDRKLRELRTLPFVATT
jgi:hypothetical protein